MIVSIFSQEKPKAELVDEFGKITCEDLIARQDNLFNQLQNEPDSMAYVVIYGDKNNAKFAWSVKTFLDGQTESRKFDKSRISIRKAEDENELKVQFWKVPAGAEKPDFQEVGWNYDLSNRNKPFIFNSSNWDVSPCPIGSQLDSYAGHLNANKNFRGYIVIFTKFNKEFQKEKASLLNDLQNDYKLSQSQLRFFHVKQNIDYTLYEFWIVPPKK